jgi:hypothetical protein
MWKCGLKSVSGLQGYEGKEKEAREAVRFQSATSPGI